MMFAHYSALPSNIKKTGFFLILLGITLFLLIPLEPSKEPIPYLDKVQHILIFVGLTLAGLFAYSTQIKALLLGLFAYAVVSEILQHLLTTTRTGDWRDCVADAIGIILAYWLFQRFVASNHQATP